MEAINHRNMTRCYVCNHFRDEERTEAWTDSIFSLCIIQNFFFESMKSSDTYSENNSDFIQIFFFDINSGISYSFLCSSDGILCIQVHLTSFLAIDKIVHIEVLYFASKLSLELRCIEMSNRPCSAYSIDKVVPEIRNSITYRCERTKTCYHYSL